MTATMLKERCVIDGGKIEIERRGDLVVKICMRCGVEDRIEGQSFEDILATDAALRDEALEHGVLEHTGITAEQLPDIRIVDWKQVARDQLAALLVEIADMEEKKAKATEIQVALLATGETLEPLPWA